MTTGNQKPLNLNRELTQRLDIDLALEVADLGVWELDLQTNLIQWNDRCQALFGLKNESILPYEQLRQYIHPDDVNRVSEAIQSTLHPGSNGNYDQTFRTLGADGEQVRWVRVKGRAYFGPTGDLQRFGGVAQDLNRQAIDPQQVHLVSEARFRALIEESPVSTCLFVGPELIIEAINEVMLGYWGRDKSVLGKPLIEALPELEGQPHIAILQEVYTSGKTHEAKGVRADLQKDGVLQTYYFDLIHKPLRDANGQVYAIMDMSIDVTEQTLARQKLEASEAHLELLRDTVPAMIFYLDLEQRYHSYNKGFMEWFGVGPSEALGRTVREFLGEQAYQTAKPHLDKAYAGQQEKYETYAPSRMNVRRWLSIVYTPHKTRSGELLGVIVLATDVTQSKLTELELRESEARYRALSADLEQQVLQRTQELASTNEELAAMNEELSSMNEELSVSNDEAIAINEDLTESNKMLIRSNNNLERFAYIASHDLQEPLRKVQQFGDILIERHGHQLGEGIAYLQRMQVAASRMSTLIRDLLTFSRISTQRDTVKAIDLNGVLQAILADLELRIQETGAVIVVDPLPVIWGDSTQLEQLFLNLLTNALKFHHPEVKPLIHVTSRQVDFTQLPSRVRPARLVKTYFQLDVKDNGIGFDEKYLDRIFEVFQRLHGKNAFSGTGIGLAICEKVVTNHGGAITASSQPDQGAVFSVYLPVL